VSVTPPRLPAYGRLRRLLVRRQLPGYHTIAAWLEEHAARAHIAHLWREVFGVEPAPGYALDAEVAFVGRVCRELFPVDTQTMDDYLNSGANPLHHGIMVDGWGVAWEVEGFHGIDFAEQPLVAAVVAAGAWQCELADRWLAIDEVRLDALEWWTDHGYCVDDLSDRLAWAADPGQAVALLRRLEPPLDGLATLYQCVAKSSGNPFLDLPGGTVQGEYLDWLWECHWEPVDIRALARAYAQVRDDIARLEHYYTWYRATPDAEQRVAAVLITLEDVYDE
jgi:hypothetical protein